MSEVTEATMFLNNLSVVDHGFIDDAGCVIGGSFNPSFLVSGKVDPHEKVVVDFSTVKKSIKAAIDDKKLGFDHKLWLIQNFSAVNDVTVIDTNGEVVRQLNINDRETMEQCNVLGFFKPNDRIEISTPFATLNVPHDAIKFIVTEGYTRADYTENTVGVWFKEYLNKCFPELTFLCNNTVVAHTFTPVNKNWPIEFFRYAHGLKDSTSWGCNNIAHGHLSFIQLSFAHENYKAVAKLQRKMCEKLNNTMFINSANVTTVSDGNTVHLRYNTCERGTFSGWFTNHPTRQKCVILPTETTIEFLVEYIYTLFEKELQELDIISLYVSEGLSKGAYKAVR